MEAQGTYPSQPMLDARVVDILHLDGLQFKDMNKNGKVDVYEDWRQPVDQRVANAFAHDLGRKGWYAAHQYVKR